MGLLEGQTGLVVGVANKRSLAWGVARAAAREGARLVLTYQNERLRENVEELAATLDRSVLAPCDVTRDEDLEALAETLAREVESLDFLVHAVAYALREELEGAFMATSRRGWALAHDVSAYSLVALVRAVHPLLKKPGGSVVTLTFEGARRVFPNYNVMGAAKASLEASVRYLASDLGPEGVRVNAISAGPVRTLAASGVRGFVGFLQGYRERAPLRRNIEAAEVGDAAVFLLSPWARGITGEILHVDGGYHLTGV